MGAGDREICLRICGVHPDTRDSVCFMWKLNTLIRLCGPVDHTSEKKKKM